MSATTSTKVTTNPQVGLSLSEDKLTLSLLFKKKAAADIANCIKLLESILILSNSFREFITRYGDKDIPKKFNETTKIRANIHSLINKEHVKEDVIDDLIAQIRKGIVEEIKTTLNGNETTVTITTDFTKLLIQLLK